METYELVKQTKQLDGYSMRWYLFFIRILSLLWLILGPMSYLASVSEEVGFIYDGSYQAYFYNDLIGPYNSITLALFLISWILILIVRTELKSFSRISWQLTIALFAIGLVSSLYTLATYVQYSPAEIIGAVSGPIVLHILNLIYFLKRRSLFGN